MRDYETGVLEQYHIEVNGTRKIRGAILCDTNQGWLLLKEAEVSDKRVPMLQQLCAHLQENGIPLVDQVMENKEGNYISIAEDGTKYVLKYWFYGRECDIRKEYEMMEAVKNLAKLHREMQGILDVESFPKPDLLAEYVRHNRELKKVRTFVREKVGKGEFEAAFLKNFNQMYEWAEGALCKLQNSEYSHLCERARENGSIVHGDYNYHNILMTSEGIATTNFEHFQMNVQAEDLYYFIRKAMEKHQWNAKTGEHMLMVYNAVNPLGKEEMDYIALRLAYPEKFWKLANSYYHSNKAWIPVKNVEKLQTAIRQTEEKKRFLKNIFAFHL